MTPEERYTFLTQTVQVPSNRGTLTNSKLGDLLTPEVAEAVYDLIKAATESYAIQYVVQGIDTSTAKWKERVDNIQAPTQEMEAIKPLIRDWELATKYQWELEGYSEAPTLEQIQAEIEQAALREFADTLIQRVSAAINLASAAEGVTQASIKAAAIVEIGA